jgi:hypothetical protein
MVPISPAEAAAPRQAELQARNAEAAVKAEAERQTDIQRRWEAEAQRTEQAQLQQEQGRQAALMFLLSRQPQTVNMNVNVTDCTKVICAGR